MERTTFVFCCQWADNLQDFEPSVRLEVYEAVIAYARNGEEVQLSDVARGAFAFIKPQVDKSLERFNEVSDKRRKAANRRWQTNANNAKACKSMQVYANANECTMSNEYMSNENMRESTIVDSSSEEEEEAKLKKDLKSYQESVVAFFNAEMDKAGSHIPRLKTKLMGKRLAMLMARVNEYGKDAVAAAIHNAAVNPFLNGGGDRGFVANFEWLFNSENFPKVLEDSFYILNNQTNGHITAYHGNGGAAKDQRLDEYKAIRQAIRGSRGGSD